MSADPMFAAGTIHGDEVARVSGIGSLSRVWLQPGGRDSNSRYVVTVTSGPGANRLPAQHRGYAFSTDDSGADDWAAVMGFVLARTAHEMMVEFDG